MFIKKGIYYFAFPITFLSIFFVCTEYTRAIGASPSTINWGNITSSTIVSAPLRITQGQNQSFSSFKTSVTGLGSEALQVDTATGFFSSSTDYYPITISLHPKNLTPRDYLLHLLITPESPAAKVVNTAVVPGITIKIIFTVVSSSYTEVIPKKTEVFISENILRFKSGLTNNGTSPVNISRITLQRNAPHREFNFTITDKNEIEPKKTGYLEITTTSFSQSFFSDKEQIDVFFYDEKNIALAHTTSTINNQSSIFQPLLFTSKKKLDKNTSVITYLIVIMCGILVAYILRKKK